MVRWCLVLAVVASCAIGACTLLDDDPPDDRCSVDTDCFRAQGEVCDTSTHRCIVRDAGIDGP